MNTIELDIVGITNNPSQKETYILILEEKNGMRRMPIIIGSNEAQAIVMILEKIQSPRPLTHDLFKTVADEIGYSISEVFINKYEDGVFYSQLIITQGERTLTIDSRTSGAIALACRFDCPIRTTEEIIAQAGITIDEQIEEKEPQMSEEDLKKEELRLEFIFDSKYELEQKLSHAIEIEDYELASVIRDELRSRE